MFNPGDLETVKSIQSGYRFVPLSTYLGSAPTENPSDLDFPEWNEGAQFTVESFNYIDFMLSLVQPPTEEEEVMKRFARIGLGTDETFELSKFPSEIQESLSKGVQDGLVEMEDFIKMGSSDPLASAKVFGTREFLQTSAQKNYQLEEFYLMRAVAAHTGIYGNSGKEAIYPTYFVDSEGASLDASDNAYTLTFIKDNLPPVSAFWSLTMYDAETQLLIDNPLDRYLLNSTMMDQFIWGDDGSVTIYIQKNSPGSDLEPNWLPAPDGPFYLTLRLYGPEEPALNGEWVNPPLVPLGQ